MPPLTRDRGFESASLQRRVCKLSLPERGLAAIDAHLAAEPAADIETRGDIRTPFAA
jgi:hypothetical protein